MKKKAKESYLALSKRFLAQVCSSCGSREHLVTHHLDGNHKNDSLENLIILCRSCHNRKHARKEQVRLPVRAKTLPKPVSKLKKLA